MRIYDENGSQVAAFGANARDDIYMKDDPKAYWRMIEKSYLLPESKPRMKSVVAWSKYCEKVDGWEFKGEADSGTKPRIQLQMTTDDERQKEKMAYWDALVDSLQPAAGH